MSDTGNEALRAQLYDDAEQIDTYLCETGDVTKVRIKKICEKLQAAYLAGAADARAEENEACAKVADDMKVNPGAAKALQIAAAIRVRQEQRNGR